MTDIDFLGTQDIAGVSYDIIPLHDGVQVKIRFANDYGLSVVRHSGSYGNASMLWEAAPIKYDAPGFDNWDFIGMAMGIVGFHSDDVQGWMTAEDVDSLAELVSKLDS
jgi:hypothetical protein